MTNEEVQEKLSWICERILQCMKVRCPEAMRGIWSTDVSAPLPREAWFEEKGFSFVYYTSNCITVTNRGAYNSLRDLVLHFNLDTHEFFWKQDYVEKYVEEIINKILVLDRLAEIE